MVLGTIPFKGQVLNQLAAYWFERDRRTSSPTTSSRRPSVPDEVARPRAGRVQRCGCRSSGGARLPDRLASGRTTRRRAQRLRASSCPTACARTSRCPTPILTPDDQGREAATTRRSASSAPPSSWATATLDGARRDVSIELFASAEHARERGLILVDTKYEFGARRRRRARLHRRDPHARLVALLVRRRLRGRAAGQPRLDKEYVRDWAAGTGWDRRRRRRRSPTTWCRAAQALHRRLRAGHRRALRADLTGRRRRIRANLRAA